MWMRVTEICDAGGRAGVARLCVIGARADNEQGPLGSDGAEQVIIFPVPEKLVVAARRRTPVGAVYREILEVRVCAAHAVGEAAFGAKRTIVVEDQRHALNVTLTADEQIFRQCAIGSNDV